MATYKLVENGVISNTAEFDDADFAASLGYVLADEGDGITTTIDFGGIDELRAERDARLSATDWWAMPDTPDMTAAQAAYRQALRDITNTYQSLDTVVWPSKPE